MELIVISILSVALVLSLLWHFTKGTSGQLGERQLAELTQVVRAEVTSAQSQALQQNSDQFLKLAETRLMTESQRGEAQLKTSAEQIANSITRLREYVETVDRNRGASLTRLDTVTSSLGAATTRLNEILGSSQARGQWGERMAEDILRLAGFSEGVQYQKHLQLVAGTGRPDFTFRLPQGLVLHMDVKFPLDAYVRFLGTESEADKTVALRDFLRAARTKVKEVTGRDYIDPANGTLDYALLFIPNEQVYGFIHERDPVLLDEALQQRVVLCSPCTLFAVLVVIRQSLDNFVLTQRTDEILMALGGFTTQWTKFKEHMNLVNRRFESTQKSFRDLVSVRRRVLDHQVERVENLRLESGLPAEELGEAIQTLESTEPGVGQLGLEISDGDGNSESST